MSRLRRIAFAVFMAALIASTTQAEPMEVSFINTDATRPTASIRLCIEGGDCIERAVVCAPQATCAEVFELPVGELTISLSARGAGTELSVLSNQETYTVVDRASECLSSAACRADHDGDGEVTASDFGTFLRVYGSTWF